LKAVCKSLTGVNLAKISNGAENLVLQALLFDRCVPGQAEVITDLTSALWRDILMLTLNLSFLNGE
jgi:hypothetical protein